MFVRSYSARNGSLPAEAARAREGTHPAARRPERRKAQAADGSVPRRAGPLARHPRHARRRRLLILDASDNRAESLGRSCTRAAVTTVSEASWYEASWDDADREGVREGAGAEHSVEHDADDGHPRCPPTCRAAESTPAGVPSCNASTWRSTMDQQQALRDFDRAMAAFFGRANPAGRPRFRSRRIQARRSGFRRPRYAGAPAQPSLDVNIEAFIPPDAVTATALRSLEKPGSCFATGHAAALAYWLL